LIEERKFRDSALAPLRNLAAALFRLENSRTRAEIDDALASLLERLKSPKQAMLRRAFSVWVDRVIMARLPGGPLNKLVDLKEMRSMLADRFDEWEAKLTRKVEAKFLLGMLQTRFGKLPGWVARRVRQAQPAQLERWGKRLFDARSLHELLDGAGPATTCRPSIEWAERSMIQFKDELAHAKAGLERRTPQELMEFILGLAYVPNGIGNYVHAFATADDPAESAGIIRSEITALCEGEREYDYRHRQGFDFAARADRALDAIETFILPRDRTTAAELLERFIASSDEILGNCHEHDAAGDTFNRARQIAAAL
jgi:hypothetical protein